MGTSRPELGWASWFCHPCPAAVTCLPVCGFRGQNWLVPKLPHPPKLPASVPAGSYVTRPTPEALGDPSGLAVLPKPVPISGSPRSLQEKQNSHMWAMW